MTDEAESKKGQSIQTDREVMPLLLKRRIEARLGSTFRIERIEIHRVRRFFTGEAQHWRKIFTSADTDELFPPTLPADKRPHTTLANKQWEELRKEWDNAPSYAVLTVQWWALVGYAWSFRECHFLKTLANLPEESVFKWGEGNSSEARAGDSKAGRTEIYV